MHQSPKRDPKKAANRPGARRVPMFPWDDPKHNNKPVTRQELMSVVQAIDNTIHASVAGLAATLHQREQARTLQGRLRRLWAWVRRAEKEVGGGD